MSNIAATIITIGDELLIGQTIDTNSAWIAQQLNKQGIDVLRRVAVGDTRNAIVSALNEELPKVSLLILTGGLGPTSDDITKPLLCEYFGGKMTTNQRVLEHLKDLFARRNRPVLERNLKQAEVPDNCTVLFNRMGTAPGMWFEKEGKIIISLPGVPFEMKDIMEQEGLPRLASQLSSDVIVHRNIFTAGEGESAIADKLEDTEASLPPYIKLAYLPDSGLVRLRVTGKGADREKLTEEVIRVQQEIAAKLGKIVVTLDDHPLEQILGDTLKAMGKTLGLAESCSGGLVGHLVTQVAGSSSYFKGSIVSYHNNVKQQVLGVKKETLDTWGAVSEQTVVEMVNGAIKVLDVDYALAVSGVLGPDGGTDRVKVGTVWMAVADKEKHYVREFRFFYDRERNKEMAAKMGMLLLWKFINNKL